MTYTVPAPLRQRPAFQALQQHFEKLRETTLTELFAADAERGSSLSLEVDGIYFDYGGTALPESHVVAAHGGSTVFVPYLSGHSTSSILERARTFPADRSTVTPRSEQQESTR